MGYPMKLELTREGLLVLLVNHFATRGDWTGKQICYWDTQFRLKQDITIALIFVRVELIVKVC